MWYVLVVNSIIYFHPAVVESAWVEIPQIPSDNKPSQFVLGAPKVSFLGQKVTTTTAPSHRMTMTTQKVPVTTLANYKKVMATTISPLTTTLRQNQQRREDKVESTIMAPKRASEEKKINKTKNKTKKNEEGFLPLLHSIQETLTVNAKKSLKSKISLLTSLRDNLLFNIDERMSSLWKRSSDDNTEARGHDDHEMDFPSNEGALMTIGFLTFAVFLIKLVLKLIHALKYKMTTVTTTTTGTGMTGTAATTFIGRKKRDLENFDSLKILQFIDEYKLS